MSRTVAAYGELVKLSHTVFALPFVLAATFLAAGGFCGAPALVLVVASMVAAWGAAMSFNRIADVRIDAANPRTADRPLQTGRVTMVGAWLFYVGSCVAFVVLCVLFLLLRRNPWPVVFAAPVLALLCGYSLTKRFTWMCHLILGAALGAGPMAAWVAVAPESIGPAAIVLAATVACWVAGFDIIYALADVDIDRRDGLWSMPSRLGAPCALWISRLLHLATAAGLFALAPLAGLGSIYLVGASLATAALLVEQLMVSAKDLRRLEKAFFQANAFVSCVAAAAAIADVILR